MSTSNLTDSELMEFVNKANEGTELETGVVEESEGPATRRLIIIGCGDGGCNIASTIAKKIPDESFVIAYNTSNRNMDGVTANLRVTVRGEDGSGKVRDYSKNVFRSKDVYKKLLAKVNSIVEELGDVAYILVCSTADGGTGSGISPMVAKLLADNCPVPVLMLGVLPSMSEDATAQYNGLQWQAEVEKIGVPYMLLDNNQLNTPKPKVHEFVNSYAAKIASLYAGKEFGDSSISIIDDKNLSMLLGHVGGRIVVAVDNTRPTAGQSLDDYIDGMLQKNYQPLPTDVRGLGVFIRGNQDLLDKMDTSVPSLQAKYGNAVLRFAHIELGDNVEIAVIMSGCSEAAGRLTEMKTRYDDIMQAQRAKSSILDDVLTNTANPLGGMPTTGKKSDKEEDDFSALDL